MEGRGVKGWLRNWLLKVLNVRHASAQYSTARTRIPGSPQDAHLDLAACDRMTLVNLSRHWEINSPLASKLGFIFEQYTVGEDGLPVSPATSSEDFNREALLFWQETEPLLDIGSALGFRHLQGLTAHRWFFDGEMYWMKTRGETGFARIQGIETHRIQTPDAFRKDPSVVDGIRLDLRTGRPLSYFVAEGADAKQFREIPATSMIPFVDQSRVRLHHSAPFLAPALNDLQDLHELQHFEMLAAKDASEITNVVYNQIGEAPPSGINTTRYGEQVTLNTGATATENKEEFYRNKVGGRTVYLQIGDKLEQHQSQRPGVAMQGFWDFLESNICIATGISRLLVRPWSMQGTVTRADLDSQAAFFRTRSAVLIAGTRNAYEYVIGQAIRMGRLKNPPKDWAKASILPPRNVNVDVGRQSEAMLRELEAGATNYQTIYSQLGLNWRDELRKKAAEARYIRDLATEFEIDPSEISVRQVDRPERFETEPAPAPEPMPDPEDPKPQPVPQNLSVNVEQPRQQQQPIELNVTLQMPEKSGKKKVQFNRDEAGQVTNWEIVEEQP